MNTILCYHIGLHVRTNDTCLLYLSIQCTSMLQILGCVIRMHMISENSLHTGGIQDAQRQFFVCTSDKLVAFSLLARHASQILLWNGIDHITSAEGGHTALE